MRHVISHDAITLTH